MDFPGTIAGFRAYGGSRPQRKRDANGVVHLGMNAKDGAGKFHYVIFRLVGASWVVAFDSGPDVGGGTMDVDNLSGELVADFFATPGDGAPSRSVAVPGFAPILAQRGPQGPQGVPGPAGPMGPQGPAGPSGSGGGGSAFLDGLKTLIRDWLNS